MDISGSTVTIDAMGCQKQIAETICGKGADYIFGLKANRPVLPDDVKLYFETEETEKQTGTLEKDHGRIEKREYYLETNMDWLPYRVEWKNLNGIGMVKTSVTSTKTGDFTQEARYFITSLTDVEQFAYAVRKHWSIESQLHWQLDVINAAIKCP